MQAWPLILLGIYSVLIVAASVLGGRLPSLMRLSHTRMQLIMSLVAGLMLGVSLLHMLPHSAVEIGIDHTLSFALLGLLAMFFMIRAFHFHQHGEGTPIEAIEGEGAVGHEHDHSHEHAHNHGHSRDHNHGRSHGHDHTHAHDHHGHDHAQGHHHGHHHGHDHAHGHGGKSSTHHLNWIGVAFGLAIHTLLDGIALATSIEMDARRGGLGWLGISTFLPIVLHKPLDALSITTLMTAGGWPHRFTQIVNAGFALMCPLGAWVFVFGLSQTGIEQQMILGYSLAFAGGVFLCISLSDLLPELQFHGHDRVKLSAALLVGIAIAWALKFVEAPHVHGENGQPHVHRSAK